MNTWIYKYWKGARTNQISFKKSYLLGFNNQQIDAYFCLIFISCCCDKTSQQKQCREDRAKPHKFHITVHHNGKVTVLKFKGSAHIPSVTRRRRQQMHPCRGSAVLSISSVHISSHELVLPAFRVGPPMSVNSINEIISHRQANRPTHLDNASLRCLSEVILCCVKLTV